MSNPFKTREFIELKAYWDDVLEKGGLPDPDKRLTVRTFTLSEAEAKKTYYGIALGFLSSHLFRCELDREIWRLHCEGMGYKRIAIKLGVTSYRVEQAYRKFQEHLRIRRK